MTADVERPVICSKCGARSGDDWSQCHGVCPLPDSPHYKATADVELPPIEHDEGMNRAYIPLPGGWEVQTKGKGSTFRICEPGDNTMSLAVPASPYLHDTLARMARDIHAAVSHATAAQDAEIARLNEAFDARERMLADIEQAHAVEIEALRAEVDRLMAIAGWGGLAGDAPERIILASEMFDGLRTCDKWLDVRRVIDDGKPLPESATAYVRADRAERLAEALREARGMVEDWARYASEYFQYKHNLQGDLAKLDATLRDHDQEKDDA